MRYAWIKRHRDSWAIRTMCRVLQVSPSGYYRWCQPRILKYHKKRHQIAQAAVKFHAESHGIYGYRKIHRDIVVDEKINCCLETVRKVMGSLGLKSKVKKRFITTTDSSHKQPVAENILQRDFSAAEPDVKWVADITYVATNEGWLYLAVVLDCFSRRVVGWSMCIKFDSVLVVRAMLMACRRRCPSAGLIHHSDRGVQYASQLMQEFLARHKIVCSMSRKGDPWDNAMSESFFGSLKTEWIDEVYKTYKHAEIELFKYIEIFYNQKRRHASLGYDSPAEYEDRYKRGESEFNPAA